MDIKPVETIDLRNELKTIIENQSKESSKHLDIMMMS